MPLRYVVPPLLLIIVRYLTFGRFESNERIQAQVCLCIRKWKMLNLEVSETYQVRTIVSKFAGQIKDVRIRRMALRRVEHFVDGG